MWWGGGCILFDSIMGLVLNLSCLFLLWSLLGLHKALLKASAANVLLKSAA